RHVVELAQDGNAPGQLPAVVAGQGPPVQPHLAAVRGHEPGHDGQERALAGTVGPDEGRQLPGLHRHRHLVQHRLRTVALDNRVRLYHADRSFSKRYMNNMPPAKLMSTGRGTENTSRCSRTSCPPTRAMTPPRADAAINGPRRYVSKSS